MKLELVCAIDKFLKTTTKIEVKYTVIDNSIAD